MTDRVQPFGDLDDFQPRQTTKRADEKVLDAIAESSNFPSRAARAPAAPTPVAAPVRAGRRYTTGRNRQINVKATDETIALFYSTADDLNQPLGAVLQMALEALARDRSS